MQLNTARPRESPRYAPCHPTRCIDTAPALSRPILLFARLSTRRPAAWTDTDSLNFLNVDGINVGTTGSDVVLHNMLDITGDCVVLFYASAHDEEPSAIKFAGRICLWKHRSPIVDYALVKRRLLHGPGTNDSHSAAPAIARPVTVGEVITMSGLWDAARYQRNHPALHRDITARSI